MAPCTALKTADETVTRRTRSEEGADNARRRIRAGSLSNSDAVASKQEEWWAVQDSNLRPID
tara:strand:- start:990 stop:1175 length:186 start_codon:yes stop_codon:yes gene_type:complete